MKKVVVTGATSFIGTHFINYVLENDAQVMAVVRRNSPKINLLPPNNNLSIVEADMESYRDLDKIIGCPCDSFFHLTWNGTRGADRMDTAMQERNYVCSVEAVKAAVRLGCKTFISAGSQAEYGSYNCPITEETICKPNTEYGKQKLRFFDTAQDLCHKNGVHFKEPRFFSLYGPDDFEGTMVISTLKKMFSNQTCELTECVQKWDFLYIDDAVRGIERLLNVECADGAYNFGSGISKELKCYIEEMVRITQSKSTLQYGAVPYPETGMVSIEPVVDKLKKETGWENRTSFNEGIKQIIAYLKQKEQVE